MIAAVVGSLPVAFLVVLGEPSCCLRSAVVVAVLGIFVYLDVLG